MKKLKFLIPAGMLAFPLTSLAATCNFSDGNGLGQCIGQVYIWGLGAAALLGLLMAIIGGYLVMSARGNAAQASKGKTYLGSSLIGIAILLGAYLLLSQINPDLTNFKINTCISGTCN
ncbi:MAG: hypothetical protein ACM3KM_03365 [Acidobacteriaceae bacterium]